MPVLVQDWIGANQVLLTKSVLKGQAEVMDEYVKSTKFGRGHGAGRRASDGGPDTRG